MSWRLAPALVAALSALACGGALRSAPQPGEPDLAAVEAGDVLPGLARVFYERVANRRFNSIATYNDPALREFFQTPEAYSDYYAGLVEALEDAHFESNRPTGVELQSFAPEGNARVLVSVRITGENGLPLRWWRTRIVRVDRWERIDGRWWIVPGKL